MPHVDEVTVPALHVVGWWDMEDFAGPIKAYQKLEKNDPKIEKLQTKIKEAKDELKRKHEARGLSAEEIAERYSNLNV